MTTGNTGTGTRSFRLGELREVAARLGLSGKSRLTVWGFEVYQRYFVGRAGFQGRQADRPAFALELAYLRDLPTLTF
jgi:hypothetical protein